jgi:ribosomal subunit interface protein
MDIIFKGRHTDVLERFRKHATGKLAKVAKLDHKAMRIDVEVTTEHNPRQSGRKERVELTITTRGPAIRAEAAAEDRFVALDLALAKLESRLRRACDRRKDRHAVPPSGRPETAETAETAAPEPADDIAAAASSPAMSVPMSRQAPDTGAAARTAGPAWDGGSSWEVIGFAPAGQQVPGVDNVIPIEMQGHGPLVIREKFHVACPMTIDQALFEMELVGHDFFLFTDSTDGLPSVVYRRRGYQYGVIRLVEEIAANPAADAGGLANGRSQQAANLASG